MQVAAFRFKIIIHLYDIRLEIFLLGCGFYVVELWRSIGVLLEGLDYYAGRTTLG